MQQLGLSKSTPKSESRLKALLWPDVNSRPGAKTAIDLGRLTTFIMAGVPAVMVTIGSMPPFFLVDAVLWAALGFGIGRGSRICAALAFALYWLGQVILYGTGQGRFNIPVPIVVTLLLLNALRGTIVLEGSAGHDQTFRGGTSEKGPGVTGSRTAQ